MLFRDVAPLDLATISSLVQPVFFERGEPIVCYGDEIVDIFIVARGVAIACESPGYTKLHAGGGADDGMGAPVPPLRELRTGECFGCEAILSALGGSGCDKHWNLDVKVRWDTSIWPGTCVYTAKNT